MRLNILATTVFWQEFLKNESTEIVNQNTQWECTFKTIATIVYLTSIRK